MSHAVNLLQAKELAVFYMSIGLLPFMHGTYAVGKSSIAQEIADENNLLLIDKRLSQCDPTDLNGYPSQKNGRAVFLPPEDIPLEGDELPLKYPAVKKGEIMLYGPRIGTPADQDYEAVYYDGWLLFLDEMNMADDAVQAAAYKITLDKKVGQRHVHSACAMIAAGNLETDSDLVKPMGWPLKTRMVHILIENDLDVFRQYAAKIGMDSRITSFINWKPSYLHHVSDDSDDNAAACNRTWEYADRVYKNKDVNDKLFVPALAGCVSYGMAMEMDTFNRVYAALPKYADIVANPEYIDIPDDMSTLWAMLGYVADNAAKIDADQLMKFVNRLPKEHQVVLMLDMGRKKPDIMKTPPVSRWCNHNANIVF